VKEYLLDNYKKDLINFFSSLPSGEPAITFIFAKSSSKEKIRPIQLPTIKKITSTS